MKGKQSKESLKLLVYSKKLSQKKMQATLVTFIQNKFQQTINIMLPITL